MRGPPIPFGSLQRIIVNWRKDTFGIPKGMSEVETIRSQVARMRKELIELEAACISLAAGDTAYLRACVKKEMCDVLVTMFSVAEEMGFELLEAACDVHHTNINREWKSNGDGTGQHTKKAPWEVEG